MNFLVQGVFRPKETFNYLAYGEIKTQEYVINMEIFTQIMYI
ncbi:hypothetical protein [Lysinibacillus sp. JNUCC 51]